MAKKEDDVVAVVAVELDVEVQVMSFLKVKIVFWELKKIIKNSSMLILKPTWKSNIELVFKSYR